MSPSVSPVMVETNYFADTTAISGKSHLATCRYVAAPNASNLGGYADHIAPEQWNVVFKGSLGFCHPAGVTRILVTKCISSPRYWQ